MQQNYEKINWKRTLDGLYHATFPKHVGINNVVTLWAEIFNDFSEHFAGTEPLLIIIDGAQVQQYDEQAIAITNLHVIPGNTNALVAIHSRSPAYMNAATAYYHTHPVPQNLRYFDTEAAAKSWLSVVLDKYNRTIHL